MFFNSPLFVTIFRPKAGWRRGKVQGVIKTAISYFFMIKKHKKIRLCDIFARIKKKKGFSHDAINCVIQKALLVQDGSFFI